MNTAITSHSPERRESVRSSSGPDTTHILQVLRSMAGLYQLLPPMSLTTTGRKAAAPQMIDNAPRLVGAMIRLLEAHGTDLPEAQEEPTELRELQDRADVYKLIRAESFQLFLLANDAYLASQSEAVARTRAALRRLRLSTHYLYRPGDPRRVLRLGYLARVESFDPKAPKNSPHSKETR